MSGSGSDRWFALGRRLRTVPAAAALALVALTAMPAVASAATLQLSSAANRSSPRALEGATVAGNVFVFAGPSSGIRQVRFYLDNPTRTGTPYRVENAAPWDLVGGTGSAASAFDTRRLTDGTHSVTAAVDLTAGGTQVLTSTFTVRNAPPPVPYELRVSTGPDRSGALPLDGRTVEGNLFAFIGPETNVRRVSFYLDDPQMARTPRRVEASRPYDFNGTSESGTATAFNTTTLGEGAHTITAAVEPTTGATRVVTATFTVANEAGGCQPLECSEIMVDLPHRLDFGQDHGKIRDAAGAGTGFTYVEQPPKGVGYIPQNLTVDRGGGELEVKTTAGLFAGTANSLDNALGVGIDAPEQVARMSATVVKPARGTGRSEQAGLYFGTDQDNYVKAVVISTSTGQKVQSLMEVNGATASQTSSASIDLTGAKVTFDVVSDPYAKTVTTSYRVNGGASIPLATYQPPLEFFSFDAARLDPRIGTGSFGGIVASHRSGPSQLTYAFDDFSVVEEEVDDPDEPPDGGGDGGGGNDDEFPFKRSDFPVPNPTAIAVGPEGELYVAELFGTIHRIRLNPDKTVASDQDIDTLGERLTLGLEVDPQSTPGDVVLYASHSSPSTDNGVANSGTVTRLSGSGLGNRSDVITGLPRAKHDHATNNMHFGSDGKLYIAQGSNTPAGATISSSELPNNPYGDRREQPLSGAMLVADVRRSGFDGSCHNASDIYGPPPCDVKTFATGLRNSFDFVFHTNGQLYAPTNGLGGTSAYPPSPTPPCTANGSIRSHNPGGQSDDLNRVEQGRYYGHPNPARGECVYRDGRYQRVPALPNYSAPMKDLGSHKSPNGTVEYLSEAFCGALKHQLLIANYSQGDDIVRYELSDDGRSVTSSETLADGFSDPLPLRQGPDGTLYVGELGAGKVTVLEPDDGGCWDDRKDLPNDLLGGAGAAVGGKLYVVAGRQSNGPVSDVHVYDPEDDDWSSAADLPGDAVESVAVASRGGKLYAFGGSTGSSSGVQDSARVYDPDSDEWTDLEPMDEARAGASAQEVDGKIYVVGGVGEDGASLSSVEVFDPSDGTWSDGPSMKTRRDGAATAVIDDELYVFGGRTRNADGSTANNTLSSVEMLDGGNWRDRASMPTGRRAMAVGTLNGRAQVIGGEAKGGNNTFEDNEEYDPETDKWRALTDMPTPRHGAAAATIDDVVYVVGGGPRAGNTFSNVNEAFSFGALDEP